jgi:hypothetical protein
MKGKVDRTKRSNIKCEHCKFYSKVDFCCHKDPKLNLSIPYWSKRPCFEWPEEVTDE